VSEALILLKERVLLLRFDIVDIAEQHAQWASLSPLAHEVALIADLTYVVVEGVAVFDPDKRLTDKVERLRAATEATLDSVKAHLARYCSDGRVVIARFIKHEVADGLWVDAKPSCCGSYEDFRGRGGECIAMKVAINHIYMSCA
jgi:hypothetical protein